LPKSALFLETITVCCCRKRRKWAYFSLQTRRILLIGVQK